MKNLRLAVIIFLAISAMALMTGAVSSKVLKSNKIVTFDCMQINDSNITIFPSACNAPDGSITGITGTGTGTLAFTWYDANGIVIGQGADLLNVSPGMYILVLRDQSKCLPVSKSYTVTPRYIIIDGSKAKITPASCNSKDGAVTGLSFSNAVQYQWFNVGGLQVASTADLTNVGYGNYTLTVTSSDGCATTATFAVPSTTPFPKPVRIDSVTGACGGGGSSLALTFELSPTDKFYTYSIYANATLKTITSGGMGYTDGTPQKITFSIPADGSKYTLVLTNPGNCSGIVGTYSLHAPVFKIINGPFFLVRNDACGRHTGGVFGLGLEGETKPDQYFGQPTPNQTWTWTDSLGNVISHFNYLASVGKGTYNLTILDIGGCRDTRTFSILDSTAEALPPAINGATLCLPGPTNLSVINPDPNLKYKLYDSTGTNVIAENNYGIFQEKVMRTTTFYATTVNGLCESSQTPVTVTVVAPGVIIPNAFTPNNDGINDYWDIPHIGDFPGAEVSVFNREGQLVYHSINYSHPFDGKYNGRNLPPGAYFYVIDLKSPECFGKISGSITLVR